MLFTMRILPTLFTRNFVNHHKVFLIPVHNDGQSSLIAQLLKAELTKPNTLGSSANTQYAHPLAGYMATLAKRFEVVVLAVVACHHAQAGRAAVHGVVLMI